MVKAGVVLSVWAVLGLGTQGVDARERLVEATVLAQGPVPQKPAQQPGNVPQRAQPDPAPRKPEPPSALAEPRPPAATGSAVGPRRLSAEERAQLREQIRDMRRRYGTDQPGHSGS